MGDTCPLAGETLVQERGVGRGAEGNLLLLEQSSELGRGAVGRRFFFQCSMAAEGWATSTLAHSIHKWASAETSKLLHHHTVTYGWEGWNKQPASLLPAMGACRRRPFELLGVCRPFSVSALSDAALSLYLFLEHRKKQIGLGEAF